MNLFVALNAKFTGSTKVCTALDIGFDGWNKTCMTERDVVKIGKRRMSSRVWRKKRIFSYS